MLLNTRPTTVLDVIPPTGPNRISHYLPAGEGNAVSGPPTGSFHYNGVPPPSKFSWLAIIVSVGFHSVVLLGFNNHTQVKKVVQKEEVVEQMLMMPDLKDEEDEKPKELNDEEVMEAPSVSVPMLADIPTLVPVNSTFVQQLDLTIPLKADPSAGKLVAIPTNIQRGRPDDSGIKNLFNISELDRAPEPIVQTNPEYPFELKREGAEARVRVGFIVDSSGKVIMPYIVSSTNRGFERAALDAVMKWKFRPGMKNGRKVNTRVEQPMDFKVTEDN
jgi:protein TonB